jgi:gamma-glutamyltranspeptidase/glutathione hydrolase
MVATAHYLASGAALDVLKEGGTAVDAAICAAATMSVVLPHMIGIGGDAFWLIHDIERKRVMSLNGSGHCGRNITLNSYKGMEAGCRFELGFGARALRQAADGALAGAGD